MECIFASDMNKALLCIGSNKDKDYNLAFCQGLLNNLFANISFSDVCITTPYGTSYKGEFVNQLAMIHTQKEKNEIISLLKNLEKQMGRNDSDKQQGFVKIDVDLVVWNDEILKPEDMNRSYIKDLLPSFCNNEKHSPI